MTRKMATYTLFALSVVYSLTNGLVLHAKSTASSFEQNCDNLSTEQAFRLDSILINPQPIFDESASGTIALHRWANAWHIITKPSVIRERLPFDEGDTLTAKDIIEAEAILRDERYIANAELKIELQCNIAEHSLNTPVALPTAKLNVTTYDNWSLIPTLSFSRSGSENRTIVGVREDNFLGLGIRTQLRYTSDEQRDGYQLSIASPVPGIRHGDLLVSLADNNDGERYQVIFSKPFYHLSSERMFYGEFFQHTRVQDIFQNGETRNSLAIDSEFYSFASGWSLAQNRFFSHRLVLGYTQDKDQFEIDPNSPMTTSEVLPSLRDYQFPWVAYEYSQRDFRVLQDIYLISQPEDINFGWQYRIQLGLELKDLADDKNLGYQLQAFVSKSRELFDGVLVTRASASASLGTRSKDYMRTDLIGEYFYRSSTHLGWYSRLSATFSSGNYLDMPIVIDDDNGVRGYPTQYQHGAYRLSASVEARYYTGYNFYQLFDLGFALFADVGRAFNGEFSALNEDDGVLASVGIGARFYSDKASDNDVIHLDFSTPLSDGESINSWEWSLQARRGF